jgi:hypothetical protein
MGLSRGEYNNNVLTFYDSVMSAPRSSSPWETFPMQSIEDPGTGLSVYDDFTYNNSTTTNLLWQIVKGTGGSITLSSSLSCGWINIPTAASSNDYQCFFTQEPTFQIPAVAGQLSAWEVYINVTEANTNNSSWFAGFTSTTTTGFLANTGLPPASYSGAVIYKTKGALAVNAQTSNAATQHTSSSAITTAVSGTSLILGMSINSNDGVTAIVTYWVSTVASNLRSYVGNGTLNLTIASLANMYFGFGVRAGSTSAETLTVDYAQAASGRYYQ